MSVPKGLLIKSFFLLAATALAEGLCAERAAAQEKEECFLLCTPELAFEPTISFENFAARPAIAMLEDGVPADTIRTGPSSALELVFALGVPTELPRIDFTFEAIWAPFAEAERNPFTGATADQLGEEIIENPVELEAELNLALLIPEETGGWLDAHFDVVDQLSPAARPEASRWYTHKLDLELDIAIAPFNWLPEGRWLRNLEVEGSLDYLVTGRPREGDRLGDELFLDDASPWSFSALLIVPLVPLNP